MSLMRSLSIAIYNGNTGAVKHLLELGVDPNWLMERSIYMGWPLLHVAAYRDDWGMCLVLLRAGARPNVHCPQGRSPLFWAKRSPEGLRVFLENGADPNFPIDGDLLPLDVVQNRECRTLLLVRGGRLARPWTKPSLQREVEAARRARATALLCAVLGTLPGTLPAAE